MTKHSRVIYINVRNMVTLVVLINCNYYSDMVKKACLLVMHK